MNKTGQSLPLISVVIPVYRVENFLRKCVDSVLAQTYTNLEIILVDDASPDDCGKICDEYATKDMRLRVIHHRTNQFLSGARNTGLRNAKGEYIAFVDSDDYIEPDMYEYLYGLISQENVPMAMCNICEDEGWHAKKQIDLPYMLIPATDIFEYSGWVYAWNKLYRRDFISDLRFNVATSYGEDALFNFELIKANVPVALGNQQKYHYCYHQNPNALTKNFQPAHLNKIIFTEECLRYAKQHHLNVYYRMSSVAQLMHASKWLKQIALSNIEDPASVQFLTKYVGKHFGRFLLVRSISWKLKLFVLVACVNFNLARKILRFYYFKVKRHKPSVIC